jgi:histidinol-phosphate/aromatic aminotransferase/cobyric acid decarboxylase-like protein
MSIADLARPEIRALAPYASARALADSAGILLNANENPWPPEGDGGLALNRYPEPQPAALRNKLARHYGIDERNLLMTRGSDEGIDLLNRAFVRPGEDGVITCPPCFGMYALSARIQGAKLQEVPCTRQRTASNWIEPAWQRPIRPNCCSCARPTTPPATAWRPRPCSTCRASSKARAW